MKKPTQIKYYGAPYNMCNNLCADANGPIVARTANTQQRKTILREGQSRCKNILRPLSSNQRPAHLLVILQPETSPRVPLSCHHRCPDQVPFTTLRSSITICTHNNFAIYVYCLSTSLVNYYMASLLNCCKEWITYRHDMPTFGPVSNAVS